MIRALPAPTAPVAALFARVRGGWEGRTWQSRVPRSSGHRLHIRRTLHLGAQVGRSIGPERQDQARTLRRPVRVEGPAQANPSPPACGFGRRARGVPNRPVGLC
jgi:hypothetical protein